MKKIVKRGALGLVGLVAVLVGVGLVLPRQWHVERSVVIDAAPEHIHPLVEDLRTWASWAREPDPTVQDTYGGAASGVGAWWAWSGPKMGHGKMTITRSDVASGVWFDEAIETEEVNAHGSLTWTREGGGTRVTWVDEGQLPPVMGGYFVGLVNDSLGAHFEHALMNLKTAARERREESAPREASQPVP